MDFWGMASSFAVSNSSSVLMHVAAQAVPSYTLAEMLPWSVAALAAAGCCVSTAVAEKRRRKLKRCRRRIEEVTNRSQRIDTAKNTYIRQLLLLFASHTHALEDYNRNVVNRLQAREFVQLLNEAQRGGMLDSRRESFYEMFDKAFLKFFPTFINDVNALLLPERRLPQGSPNKLSHEGRMLAFLRMGIDDSSLLASLLGVSVNSLYTYRTKMKNRAENRAEFEENIRKIAPNI